MNLAEIQKAFEKSGAILQNSHLVYTSGRHGSAYVNKDALYPNAHLTSVLCKEMANKTKDLGVDVVVGPALGGIILSQWVGFYLSELCGKTIPSVYAEKADDSFVLRRGYGELVQGKNVLVVEDILTTGGSVKKLVEVIRAQQGKVVAVSALCNRGGISAADLGNVPVLHALLNIQLESWEAKDCPLCAKGVPINTKVGKGK